MNVKTKTQNYIGGKWVGEPSIEVVNPATGDVLATVADAGREEALEALEACVKVQAEWAATPPRERANILRKAYDLILERKDDFAELMTREMGKPLAEAYGEVTYGADFIRWASEETERIHGRYGTAPAGNMRIVTDKVPVGPVLAITPWNFPLAMATRKIGPALAAGCTVILKPAALTPLTALLFTEILEEAGLPGGVVNTLVSSNAAEISEPLLEDPRIRKLTFTGSTGVGRELLKLGAKNVVRTSMELGGNAPFVVLESADLDETVEALLVAKFRNNGQACTAANRFYIHENVYDDFVEKLLAKLEDYPMGDGMDEKTKIGPLITEKAVEEIKEKIDAAVADGAKILIGGEVDPEKPTFLPPTVLENVKDADRISCEEIFGPVVPLQKFSDESTIHERANDTEFGLMGYVYGTYDKAMAVAEKMETGMVAINVGGVSNPAAPFGGVKASGLGREGSFEGIEEYLETRYFGMTK